MARQIQEDDHIVEQAKKESDDEEVEVMKKVKNRIEHSDAPAVTDNKLKRQFNERTEDNKGEEET